MTLDGPIPCMTRDASGALTDTPAPGVHYNTTPSDLAAHPALQPYVVAPSLLQRIWAGDDPAAPTMTVALVFPDQATADAVFSSIAG